MRDFQLEAVKKRTASYLEFSQMPYVKDFASYVREIYCPYCFKEFWFTSDKKTFLGRLADGADQGLYEIVGHENCDFFAIHSECKQKYYVPGDTFYEWVENETTK